MRLIAGFAIVATLVGVALAAESAATQPSTPEDSRSGWRTPLWKPGAGPLWFGFHPPGRELTVEEVQEGLGRWILRSGNTRLKVGSVTEKNGQTITAEIVTVDNSLVQGIEIDRRSGMVRQQLADGVDAWRWWGPPHGWGPWMEREGWRAPISFPLLGCVMFALLLIGFATFSILAVRHQHIDRRALASREGLDQLYARGQIDRTEYLRKKSRLVNRG
ncbi:MAG: hypothetical protein ACKVQT_06115 [Burkholderiales bacterium]